MSTTERIEAQVARQREALNAAAGTLGHRAADALSGFDAQAIVDRAAEKAGDFADAADARAAGPSRRGRKVAKGLLALAVAALGLAWLRSRS